MALALVQVFVCVFALLYVHTPFMVNKGLFFLPATAFPTLIPSLLGAPPQRFGRRISVGRPTFVSQSDAFPNDVYSV